MSELYPDGLPVFVDPEAERLGDIVSDLAYRLRQSREGSAEYRLLYRQLDGIRRGSQLGALIVEEYQITSKI